MAHIFISYSHKDTEYAHVLAKNLQEMGFDVWIDERLDYGSQWPQELQKQLDSCSAFILIMSPRSYASDWVQSELQRARRKMKPVFPLLLEGDEPWLSVESTQYYDVRGGLYPDAKFYAALKNVMSATPAARTLKMSKQGTGAKLTQNSSKLNMTLILALVGIVTISLIGFAFLLLPRLSQGAVNSTAPAQQPTDGEVVGSEATQPPQINRPGDYEMALVPAGEFTMGGSAADEVAVCLEQFESACELSWFMDEERIHKVHLDAFYIDIYEVTNALYKDCEDQGACEPPQSLASNNRPDYYDNPEFDHFPVIAVSWHQAKAYCEWRGARLPTEAEWEKAACGTDERMYPWGEGLDETFANFHWKVRDTTEVGSYEKGKSPYGLYDMAGNVWEWTNSLYRPYPYDADDGRESPNSNDLRIARGGSWGLDGDISVSVAFRIAYGPDQSSIDRGFRCAMDANP